MGSMPYQPQQAPPQPSSAPHKVPVAMRMIVLYPKYTLVNWASDDRMVLNKKNQECLFHSLFFEQDIINTLFLSRWDTANW